METKQCSKCKKILPISSFRWRNKQKHSLHSQCKECEAKAEKERYKIEKDRQQNIVSTTLRHKARNMEYINSVKSCGCQKCGDKRLYVLDFHHKDKDEKENTINRLRTCSLEKLKEEISKCVVLCSNCHREFHYLEFQNQITIEDYLKS